MAQKTQKRREARSAGAESEFAGGEFAAFAREDAEDHRNFRLALGGAVVFHLDSAIAAIWLAPAHGHLCPGWGFAGFGAGTLCF